MLTWRGAIVIGIGFVVVGIIYGLSQVPYPQWLDVAGMTMLLVLGVAMAFSFAVILRGSREL
jgi:hypothetical protein